MSICAVCVIVLEENEKKIHFQNSLELTHLGKRYWQWIFPVITVLSLVICISSYEVVFKEEAIEMFVMVDGDKP